MSNEKEKKSICRLLRIQFDKVLNESVAVWRIRGCPVPPPHRIKEEAIRNISKEKGCTVFVETGTYLGDMICAQMSSFEWIASVELSDYYYKKARERFMNVEKVHLYQGDSGEELEHIISDAPSKKDICFWLDGHYSEGKTARGEKDTPIIQELETILRGVEKGVIMIDDARCFIGRNDYPTIDYLKEYVFSKRKPIQSFDVENDIIRIVFG